MATNVSKQFQATAKKILVEEGITFKAWLEKGLRAKKMDIMEGLDKKWEEEQTLAMCQELVLSKMDSLSFANKPEVTQQTNQNKKEDEVKNNEN